MESVHHLLILLVLRLVPPRSCYPRAFDIAAKRIEVEPDVDARVVEGLHALVVVGGRVDVVDADAVGAEGFHEGGVELALGGGERVVVGELVGDACEALGKPGRSHRSGWLWSYP